MGAKLRIAAAALIAVVLAAAPAAAEEEGRVLPAGTTIQLPRDGERLELGAEMYLVSRESIDRANATAETSRRLTADLVACSEALLERDRPEPGWQIAARWTAIGLAIGGAFVAGIWVGS